MKEIFKTFLSLTILILISTLIYLVWIINKGEFTSQYLEKFINDNLEKKIVDSFRLNEIYNLTEKKINI